MPAVTSQQMLESVKEWAKKKGKSSPCSGGGTSEDLLTRFLALLESKEVIVGRTPKRIEKAEESGWLIESTKCPFDGNHPARFFVYQDHDNHTSAGFKCFRCTDKHWKDIETLWGIQWPDPSTTAAEAQSDEDAWLYELDPFLKEEVPDMTVYLEQEGVPILFDGSAHEIYAYRGVGKSYFSHQLVATLVHGGEWLRFKSVGGFKVVIVDVELTRRQLVKRFQSTIGESGGRVRIMTPEKMDGRFPRLLDPAHQEKLVEELKSFGAQILIIDSLTAAFRIDTNNQDHLAAINDFLRRLKIVHRLCVIILHHAGKNTTQRGRSDIEDHLETVIKLTPLPDALPGEIRVKFEYEKKREEGVVANFDFEVQNGRWSEINDPRTAEIVQMLLQGKSWRSIEQALHVSSATIARVKRTAEKNGQQFPLPGSRKQSKTESVQ